jgi:hypothetical protein
MNWEKGEEFSGLMIERRSSKPPIIDCSTNPAFRLSTSLFLISFDPPSNFSSKPQDVVATFSFPQHRPHSSHRLLLERILLFIGMMVIQAKLNFVILLLVVFYLHPTTSLTTSSSRAAIGGRTAAVDDDRLLEEYMDEAWDLVQ